MRESSLHAGHGCVTLQNKVSVADFKAESFSTLSHLLLNGRVVVKQTVLCGTWASQFYQEQLHSLFKTFYQPFIQNVFCKLNSEGELNSYCLADFRVFPPRQNTNLCAY